MDFNNSIIICEENYKEYYLNEFNKNHEFFNVNFYTKKKFLENYLFSISVDGKNYLYQNKNLKIDVINTFLDNIYYHRASDNEKLKMLDDIYNELKSNNFIIQNDLFKDYIKNKKIFVVGYEYLTNIEENLFKDLNASFIKFISKNKKINVFECNLISDEVNFVFKKISELLTKGININNIKIAGVDDSYNLYLEKYSYFYNIPIKLQNNDSLYALLPVQKYLNNNDFNELNNLSNENYNKVITILNKYPFDNNKDFIVNDLKNTTVYEERYKNFVEVKPFNSPFGDDDYVFLMNFNEGCNPKYKKDDDFITVNEALVLNEKTVNEINEEKALFYVDKINSINNITITYKTFSDQVYYPSSLIKILDANVTLYEDDPILSYSKILDNIKYISMLDVFYKYGNKDENINIYKNTFNDFKYNSYDNRYTKIDRNYFLENNKKGLTLSYTALDSFNKCAFKYFLSKILKLDKYEETFDTFIGSLFHDVLQKALVSEINIDEEIDNYIRLSKKEFSSKDRFFLEKLRHDIKDAVKYIKAQDDYILYKNILTEKNIRIKKDSLIPITFMGFIDKILYDDNENVAIIDYKTGSVDLNLNNVIYGFDMQLPTYVYLVKHSGIFEKPNITGFYLQEILNKDLHLPLKEGLETEKSNLYKLKGYSSFDVSLFDKTYENSKLIKGLKVKNDGSFYANSKVLSKEQINNLSSLCEEKINEDIDKILNTDFDINPKLIGKESGCKYCKFKDICYRKEKDYVKYDEITCKGEEDE